MSRYNLLYNGANETTVLADQSNNNILERLRLSKLIIVLDKDTPGSMTLVALDEDDPSKIIKLNALSAAIEFEGEL